MRDASGPLEDRFPTGKSPFHIKGLAYRGHNEFTEKHVPGGVAAMLPLLPSDALRDYFKQPFLAASWYDVFPLVAGGIACARLMGMTHPAFMRHRSQLQAKEDIRGVYKVLLKIASPQMVAMRLVRIITQYYDYGGSEVEASQPGLVQAVRTGVPAPLAPSFVCVAEPYAEAALTIAGGKDVRVKAHAPQPDGAAHGVPTVRIRIDLAWK